ncbi:MAG: hypothetical protein QM758_07535 [Armatimonas sp.]
MVFARRMLTRSFADYTRYRPFLRQDFQYRCAYCLTHEFYLGGEAGCTIDHHRPQHGLFARPDLVNVYENLYWCCHECNQNKGDTWPTPDELAEGRRFLDPCLTEDDHDLHWETMPDGTITPQTPAGDYTIDQLMLWREQLTYLRQRQGDWQRERSSLIELCGQYELSDEALATLNARLAELNRLIEPPVFDRPRR